MDDCQQCGETALVQVRGVLEEYHGINPDGSSYLYLETWKVKVIEGGYISFSFCVECGQIQGEFPVDCQTLKR